jgi:hypothetical protein
VSNEGEIIAVVLKVACALESIGVEYLVGGSVAASLYGEPRSTRDIDIAVRLPEEKLPQLVNALGPEFAVDEEAMREAIHARRSANIFYLPLVLKVDLFMRGDSEYDQVEFSRRTTVQPVEGASLRASSPEDNLLWKLRWFKLGGEVSEQQWRDILGLLRVSGSSLDMKYLSEWSATHAVSELLQRALKQIAP